MKKSSKAFLIGAGVLAAGAAALGALHNYTTNYLVQLALNREAPKGTEKEKEKFLSSGDMSEIIKKILDASKLLEETPHQVIEIEAQDGEKLVGHWYCPEKAKRVIVAMHGWRSNWAQDFGAAAPFWFSNDCAVLLAEQRGQGNSGGEYMGFGLLERFDCLDWVNWVNDKTKEEVPIYLDGISMGGATVLMTTGFDLPKTVKGVISDCAFTSPHAIWKHVIESNFHLPYSLYSRAASDLCEKQIKVAADSYSTLEAMKVCKVPVLFVHGTDDHFVPVEMTYENYKTCVSPKELLIVPGAEHGMSYLVAQKDYEKIVKAFWKKYDN